MAQWYRCQATIPNDNGLPADAAVNTWSYMIAGSGDRDDLAVDFGTQLSTFYGAFGADFGSADYNWDAIAVKHYDMLDPTPRLPFYEHVIDAAAADVSANTYPGEVAICLSMEGERESGVNMRRRRGRVYLGPLGMGSFDLPIATSTIADLVAAAANEAFFDAGNLAHLAVYSPYTHHAVPVGENIKDFPDEVSEALPASFHLVTRLWVDNAWDTQRRRGRKATYRKTYNAP